MMNSVQIDDDRAVRINKVAVAWRVIKIRIVFFFLIPKKPRLPFVHDCRSEWLKNMARLDVPLQL